MKSPCIVEVIQHLKPGGIESLVLDLNHFISKDHQTYIVCLEGSFEESLTYWPKLENIKERLIFLNKPAKFDTSLFFKLAVLFKQLRATAVHTHHIGPLFYAGVAARMAMISTLVHTEHDSWYLRDDHQRNIQQKLYFWLKPTVVADAHAVSEDIEKYLNYSGSTIIHNGIDTHKFTLGNQQKARQQFELPDNCYIVGSSGRLEPEKGHHILIDAMTRLPKHIILVIAGFGSQYLKLKQKIFELELHNQVFLLGRVKDMPSFYHAIDLFCLPSLEEGMPLAPLEAQSCGVPVVLTTAGGSQEALCPITGTLVPKGSSRALASSILDASMCSQKAEPSRQFILENADIYQTVNAYLSLFGHTTPIPPRLKHSA
ncbi:glycosyltransferase [Aliivibrio kagoshimensis]|uniref:glycosyltransferase n=1 Tax=Aliivibrio kagoshimensis TaxID=2910230 RepID=UPI003D1452A7